jgi:SAM-dependent methyltransferase
LERHGEEIMGKMMAFQQSRIILTGAELDVFTRLDEAAATAAALSKDLGCDSRAMGRLLDALTSLTLLKKEGGLFRLSGQGMLLSSRHPETILPMVLHCSELWQKWSGLTGVVRTGKPVEGAGGEKEEANRRAFIGAMHAIGRNLATETSRVFDAGRFRRLLDIGGGSGTYTIAFLRRNQAMTAVLFDLAPVIPMAGERLQAEGLADRVTLVAGDFSRDELPSGCDLALLSAIIHQNSPARNLDLFRKIFRALHAGGSILIRDHVMDESHTLPPGGAIFAVNMLVGTAGGDTYTFGEIKEGLEKAGFAGVSLVQPGGEEMDGLVEARKVQ